MIKNHSLNDSPGQRRGNETEAATDAKRPRKIETWSVEHVTSFLVEYGFEDRVQAFEREEVDGARLLELKKSELRDTFGLTNVRRQKDLMAEVHDLRDPVSVPVRLSPIDMAPKPSTTQVPRQVGRPRPHPQTHERGSAGSAILLGVAIVFLAFVIIGPICYAGECGCAKSDTSILGLVYHFSSSCHSIPWSFLCWWSCAVHGQSTQAALFKTCFEDMISNLFQR